MKYCLYSLLLCLAFACSSSPEKQADAASNGEKPKAATISSENLQPASKDWVGTWERKEWGSDATLEITAVKEDSIYFTMSAYSGGNEGGLEGSAVVVNNKAVFTQSSEYDDCRIEFILQGDSIWIDQKSGFCDAGNGVLYSGSYKSEKWLTAHPVAEETLFSLGIFETKEQDAAFRALVRDDYSDFLSSTQLTVDGDDLDHWNAKVKTSGVRGMYTIMENVIMIDAENHIWAALIRDGSVVYYTNSPKDAASLPKTIDSWREGFADYEVVYASRPE